MLKNNTLVDDIAKIASGAAGSALQMRQEVEALIHGKVDQLASQMQLVTREEFEVVQALAAKAMAQNAELLKRIEALEAKLK